VAVTAGKNGLEFIARHPADRVEVPAQV
jgi:hypothetical protein